MRRPVALLLVLAGAAALLLAPLAGAESAPPTLGLPSSFSVSATGSAGAVVTFSVTAGDDTDPSPIVLCIPGSGSLFPLGSTTVSCTATDLDLNVTSGSFTVTVRDAVAPSLGALPANVTTPAASASGAVVTYATPGATDDVDPSPTVACAPASGSTFPIATTTVTCTATDDAGNTSSGSFTVTVRDTTPPGLTLPGDMVAEASGPGGAAVGFSPVANDWLPVAIVCTPAPGATFPLGRTTVRCTASDAAAPPNQTSGSFDVTVRDTVAPALSVPATVVADAVTSSGATVAYPAATADDAVDPSPTVSCAPASGSVFPVGDTSVSCTARDDAGNDASRSFLVRVRDATPPAIAVPGARVAEADGPRGSTVSYTVTASDLGAPLLPSAVSCSPASGARFPLGTTTVSCRASDAAGNVGTAGFSVTVRDTTPPTIVAADITVAATSRNGIGRGDAAIASYLRSLGATDLVSAVKLTVDAPETFPVGTTPVTITAVDGAGNSVSRRVAVTVLPLGQPAPPPPDLTPPRDPSGVRVRAGDRTASVTWVAPRTDVAAVEVRMSASGESSQRLVYRGSKQAVTVRGLRNGTQYRFVVVSVDKAGNRSRGVVVLTTPKARPLLAPKNGARLTRPPLLRWKRVAGATYFNVQLYRGKAKLLSAWPDTTKLQLGRTWRYGGVKRTLAPGAYTWYVWPGLGARSDARYGPLLGKGTFKVTKKRQPPAV